MSSHRKNWGSANKSRHPMKKLKIETRVIDRDIERTHRSPSALSEQSSLLLQDKDVDNLIVDPDEDDNCCVQCKPPQLSLTPLPVFSYKKRKPNQSPITRNALSIQNEIPVVQNCTLGEKQNTRTRLDFDTLCNKNTFPKINRQNTGKGTKRNILQEIQQMQNNSSNRSNPETLFSLNSAKRKRSWSNFISSFDSDDNLNSTIEDPDAGDLLTEAEIAADVETLSSNGDNPSLSNCHENDIEPSDNNTSTKFNELENIYLHLELRRSSRKIKVKKNGYVERFRNIMKNRNSDYTFWYHYKRKLHLNENIISNSIGRRTNTEMDEEAILRGFKTIFSRTFLILETTKKGETIYLLLDSQNTSSQSLKVGDRVLINLDTSPYKLQGLTIYVGINKIMKL